MAPRFRIEAHVLVFGLLAGGGTLGALAISNAFAPSEEEKEKELVRTPQLTVLI